MDSKEWIKGVLYNVEEALDTAKETKNKDLEIDCKMQKEYYNQVLKDLEDYEELKELMGTPILDIMKKLKVLKILKVESCLIWVENGELYSGRYGDIRIPLDEWDFNGKENQEAIKEWLDNDNSK